MWKTAHDITDQESMLTVRISQLHKYGHPPEFSYSVGILNPIDDTMRRFFPHRSDPREFDFLIQAMQSARVWIENKEQAEREKVQKEKADAEEERRQKTEREMSKRKRHQENLDARAEENRARLKKGGNKG